MFITTLELENVRTFAKANLDFVHPDLEYAPAKTPLDKLKKRLPRPRLPNVNLLLGDNGSGKTTLLRAIAMSALGPSVTSPSAGIRDPGLVRRGADLPKNAKARLVSAFGLHPQDRAPEGAVARGELEVGKRGDTEEFRFLDPDEHVWEPVFEEKNDAFLVVGYGATRRVEQADRFDMGSRTKTRFIRGQRIASLYEDGFSLIPLTYWLPDLQKSNKGRYTQVVHLLKRLIGPGHYTFTEELERGDYLFERGGMKIPFRALSDGYRAFIGWVGDLLYHVCYGAPSGKKLDEGSGIVLVDEIDLHLHPRWQMKVIPTIAKALPRMQFVFTSHSPLVAGSLEWMNIITLKTNNKTNRTKVGRLQRSIHGLDADQILLSDLFGLTSTRAEAKTTQLHKLTAQAREGDDAAALQIVRELSRGLEESP
ncbi:recombination protein F [Gemmata obscuriglobus]|uniref:ATP-binding protein n=1 Tax=Gemmata obscuriglobus TaxID=114 RepID=A0A2Z3H1G7_9BACT|nr:ATP-binding protein [Gemmata obscuriglobus]AWM36975.1 ATP-binding protein [Gemmata obscuriglobus]QEG30340.1 recombination protein F [Gemmata obscuriglobus]VTS09664.1 atp-binding protein : ATP-binding protein involved in virulence OS=Mesorhizobium opportunistum (strain LMG 24607 / HAMBI 3007 / WSM2075) GN=Mesop_5492 PE=4 SV=1: AAA_23: AAA_21 [Gemmata obscuriglobus UQM 2246]